MTKSRKHVGAVAIAALLAAAVSMGILQACSKPADHKTLPVRILDARRPNTTPSQFIRPGPHAADKAKRTLLLFVHGIFGDTVSTWCNENGRCLHQLIVSSPEFADKVDAYAFGYPSDTVKQGSFDISEAARSLYTEIKFREFLEQYRQMVVVAHSMGGLVSLELLTTYEDVALKVPLIVTFSTPYDGSQIAELGGRLLENPALTDMIRLDGGNTFLTSLNSRWRTLRNRLLSPARIVCAYETMPVIPLFSTPIVAHSSAVALCDEAADAIAEDHIGIVKPGDDSHPSFKILVNALRDLDVRQRHPKPVDFDSIALLARITDSKLRVDFYKKMTGDANPDKKVIDEIKALRMDSQH